MWYPRVIRLVIDLIGSTPVSQTSLFRYSPLVLIRMFFFYFKLLLYKSRTVTINPISLLRIALSLSKSWGSVCFLSLCKITQFKGLFFLLHVETYLGRNLTNLGQNSTKLHKTCFFNKVRSPLLSKTSKTFIFIQPFFGSFWGQWPRFWSTPKPKVAKA